MSPELTSILDQFVSVESIFFKRSWNLVLNDEKEPSVQVAIKFIDGDISPQICNYSLESLEHDNSFTFKLLEKCWYNYTKALISYFEENWIHIEKETPQSNQDLIMVITTRMGDLTTDIAVSEGFFVGTKFQIDDQKAEADVSRKIAEIQYWPYA